ncbi:MAG: methionyl-tRNA formyltransferase [Ruminococcaceae bacterium]|nr:methionyl-tRNA formyltransferase [Oscillospiraceae bacterium]
MKVLFMGTPDFAVPTLEAIIKDGHEVVGVVSQPDKPRGRGHHLAPTPVKEYAQSQGIEVYQPLTLKSDEFMTLLLRLDPDVIVVVAYGKILPLSVLEYPKYGCVNVHGSLLPEYRGAAPMQRAIIDGKRETGITTMLMAAGLDTGDMLLREAVEIGENDNFEDIHDRLAGVGACLLVKTLSGLEKGEITPKAQDDSLATYAAKIEKSDCLLDFSRSAKELHDLIRGLSPIPLSFTHMPDGKLLKVVESSVFDEERQSEAPVGTVLFADNDIKVACGKGILSLVTVVPEGKGRMSAADFVRGRKIAVGDILK